MRINQAQSAVEGEGMIQDELQKIYELSQIDLQIRDIRQKMGDLPRQFAETTRGLKDRERQLLERKEKRAVLDKEKNSLELESAVSRDRLTEFNKKMNQIKTNKEYQAALKEVAETRQAQKLMEDRVLQLMTEMEALDKEMSGEETAFDQEKKREEEQRKSLSELEKQVDEDAKSFEEKRRELVRSIESRLLSQYERIRLSLSDPVAVASGGTCQGCFMKISPQLYIEIQKYQEVHKCPSCHRILYLQGGPK
jgi:hypothetical protein